MSKKSKNKNTKTERAASKKVFVIGDSGSKSYRKTYRPISGSLDRDNPPRGGSGVPTKESASKKDDKK
jgi:hypothetical protein